MSNCSSAIAGSRSGRSRATAPGSACASTILSTAKLFGTGGAIRRALDRLGPEFLVTYGDAWLDTPYAAVVKAFYA